jgi:ATP-binding cassette subfamily B protein
VDTHTERNHSQLFEPGIGSKTAILITHRIVGMFGIRSDPGLDHGKLVEEGTHEELMARQGFYYDLWQQQLVSSVEEEA